MLTLGKLASPDLKSSAIQQRCRLEVADFPSFSWSLMLFVILRSRCSVGAFLHMEISLHVNEVDFFEYRHWQHCTSLVDSGNSGDGDFPRFSWSLMSFVILTSGVQFLYRSVDIGGVILAALPYQMSSSLM